MSAKYHEKGSEKINFKAEKSIPLTKNHDNASPKISIALSCLKFGT